MYWNMYSSFEAKRNIMASWLCISIMQGILNMPILNMPIYTDGDKLHLQVHVMTASCVLLRDIVHRHHETHVIDEQGILCQKTFSGQDIASTILRC